MTGWCAMALRGSRQVHRERLSIRSPCFPRPSNWSTPRQRVCAARNGRVDSARPVQAFPLRLGELEPREQV